jgi:hypothetical protein
MPHRLTCCVVLLLCAGIVFGEERNWKKHPAIVEMETKNDIYAIGDVHGDYERLINMLVVTKLIEADPGKPEKVKWSAGKAVLVCTGDMIDKGDHSVRVLQLFMALQADAAKAGGRVVVTMGNHEAEFLVRPRAEKAADFIKDLTDRGIKPEDVAAGTDSLGLGTFLRSLPFAARVNDWFFAHAGNTRGKTLARLKEELEGGVDGKGFSAAALLGVDGLLESRLKPQPWWENGTKTAADAHKQLQEYLKALGVNHLVIGHQGQKITFVDGTQRKAGELFQKYDGLIFLIDVGMSRKIGYSTGAILHIHEGAEVIDAEGKSRRLWRKE